MLKKVTDRIKRKSSSGDTELEELMIKFLNLQINKIKPRKKKKKKENIVSKEKKNKGEDEDDNEDNEYVYNENISHGEWKIFTKYKKTLEQIKQFLLDNEIDTDQAANWGDIINLYDEHIKKPKLLGDPIVKTVQVTQEGASQNIQPVRLSIMNYIYNFIKHKNVGNPNINKIYHILNYANTNKNKMVILPRDIEKIKKTQYLNPKELYLDKYRKQHLITDKINNIAIYDDLTPNIDLYTSNINLKKPEQFMVVDRKLIKMLLSNKCNINLKDHSNRTPLHYAITYLGVGIIKQLLGRGKARLFDQPNSPYEYYINLFMDYCNMLTGKFIIQNEFHEYNESSDEDVENDNDDNEDDDDDEDDDDINPLTLNTKINLESKEGSNKYVYIHLFKQHLDTISKDNEQHTLYIFIDLINSFIENINKHIIGKRYSLHLPTNVTVPDVNPDKDCHYNLTVYLEQIIKDPMNYQSLNNKNKAYKQKLYNTMRTLEHIFICILKSCNSFRTSPIQPNEIQPLRSFADYFLNKSQHYDYRYTKETLDNKTTYTILNQILKLTINKIVDTYIKNDIIEEFASFLFVNYKNDISENENKDNLLNNLKSIIYNEQDDNKLLYNLREYGNQCIHLFFYKNIDIDDLLNENEQNPLLNVLLKLKEDINESVIYILYNHFNIHLHGDTNNDNNDQYNFLNTIKNHIMDKYTKIFKLFMTQLSEIFIRYISYIENQLRFIRIGKHFLYRIHKIA